ncbi:jg16245 [Pararge aegeria aegeria]|uniref:Jg16245 protein n=1 Tax=Pararge aegeria aegeria TaxID=348720 RepID=A0A8S4S1U6_9NEOP|nr:jg16245 [Pararge aegeria aegeria]
MSANQEAAVSHYVQVTSAQLIPALAWNRVSIPFLPRFLYELIIYPMDPPNDTDPEQTINRVKDNDQTFLDLNWNNIKNISDEKIEKLFEALKTNTHLEVLSLVNVGLNDRTAQLLADALEANSSLRVVNVETNFISPAGVVQLVKALLTTNTVEEFRASNQRSQVLGNKTEMEITRLVEQNPTLLRLGLHLEYSDARHRVASHLQRNIDRIRKDLTLRLQFRFFNNLRKGARRDGDNFVRQLKPKATRVPNAPWSKKTNTHNKLRRIDTVRVCALQYASNAGARAALRSLNDTRGGRIRRLTLFTRSPSYVAGWIP